VVSTGNRDRVVIAQSFTFNGDPGNPKWREGGNNRKHMIAALEGLRGVWKEYGIPIFDAWID